MRHNSGAPAGSANKQGSMMAPSIHCFEGIRLDPIAQSSRCPLCLPHRCCGHSVAAVVAKRTTWSPREQQPSPTPIACSDSDTTKNPQNRTKRTIPQYRPD
ncbi:hypothetical protein RMSM_07669 [Rhodopirellula maiorica SM1]|uniref:Uncharacterized protein n=1 Tax=Rhodopirellula maiorica SM1 TaxID=1265738 RepID=M5R7P5_9BACT|nr:hypothetical protein RMSM_07669 [Rhodopirellula maiorica SM1]